jgi:hypothetical protein
VVRDEIEGYVSGLLGLVGIAADPLVARAHPAQQPHRDRVDKGQSLDLGTLVDQVQQPPMRKLGVFELDQFFRPPTARPSPSS